MLANPPNFPGRLLIFPTLSQCLPSFPFLPYFQAFICYQTYFEHLNSTACISPLTPKAYCFHNNYIDTPGLSCISDENHQQETESNHCAYDDRCDVSGVQRYTLCEGKVMNVMDVGYIWCILIYPRDSCTFWSVLLCNCYDNCIIIVTSLKVGKYAFEVMLESDYTIFLSAKMVIVSNFNGFIES